MLLWVKVDLEITDFVKDFFRRLRLYRDDREVYRDCFDVVFCKVERNKLILFLSI